MDDLILPGYTRVTEPLQGFSKYDMVPEIVLEKAQDKGNAVHNYCEMYVKGLLFDTKIVEEEYRNYVDCFVNWFVNNVEHVFFTENRFYNEEYKLTGKIDLMARLKDGDDPVVIDIKTTYSVSKSWSLQTAAYSLLSGYLDKTRRIALNLPKTGSKIKVIEYDDYENDLRLYLNCLELYRYLNPAKKVKGFDFPLA